MPGIEPGITSFELEVTVHHIALLGTLEKKEHTSYHFFRILQ